MKKIYTCIVFLSTIAVSASAAWDGTAAAWTTGDGSAANPFQIANEQNLAYLQETVTAGETYEGKYFILTSNLDMSGKTLNPIGFHDDYSLDNVWHEDSKPFLGTFDGGYFTIDNVTIKLAAADTDEIGGVGLFALGRAATKIQNLKLGEKVVVDGNGSPDVGGIMGISYGATIENCSFAGSMTGGTTETGGIVGAALEGSVVNGCVNTGILDSNMFTGGIVGELKGASMRDCLNFGAVNGNKGYWIGGVAAWLVNSGTVKSTMTSCVSMGPVLCDNGTGSSYTPGKSPVCAEFENSTAQDCYYVKALTGCAPLAKQQGVTEVTEAGLKEANVLTALNGGNATGAWTTGADGYPVPAWTLIVPAGIEAVGLDAADANVSVTGGSIVIEAESADVTVCDIAGRTLYDATVSGQAVYTPATGGIYVVAVRTATGSSVYKLVI